MSAAEVSVPAPAPAARASSSASIRVSRPKKAIRPVQLTFKDLKYTVDIVDPKTKKTTQKVILNNINGYVRPGQALAIMGASGSGKTSLLNILAGRVTHTSGSIQINGETSSRELIKRVGGYVPQNDILSGVLTPREALQFVSELELPQGTPEEEKKTRVDSILAELGLLKSQNTITGFVGEDSLNSGLKRGISGGERKRLAVGLELMHNPSLIFLDELTTGLDSYAATSVVRTCQRLAKIGHTILFSIHQPGPELFDSFDQLMLLGNGRCLYFGPAKTVINYFANLGLKCPRIEAPPDFLLRIVQTKYIPFDDENSSSMSPSSSSVSLVELPAASAASAASSSSSAAEIEPVPSPAMLNAPATPAISPSSSLENLSSAAPRIAGSSFGAANFKDRDEQVKMLAESFEKSVEYTNSRLDQEVPSGFSGKELLNEKKERASWLKATKLVLRRQALGAWREPALIKAGLGQLVFSSIFVGLLFLRMKHDQKSIQDRSGSLFFSIINTMFASLIAPIYQFAPERKVFLRENANGLYGASEFFVGKLLSVFPIYIYTPLIWSAIAYWMMNFNPTAEAFFFFVFILFLTQVTAFAFGLAIVSGVPDPATALQVIPVLFIPLFVFSGFFIQADSIPKWLAFLEYPALTKYAWRSLMNNEFQGAEFYCTASELATFNGICPTTSGEQVLKSFALTGHDKWIDALALALISVGLFIISFLFLRRSANRNK